VTLGGILCLMMEAAG